MSRRAGLYLRVSTLDQHSETQLYDLRTLARQRGLEIVKEYTDRGISGARARRPALDELLRDARRGEFDVVVVWACDRLARSVSHFLAALDELSHLNIEFLSFREQLNTGGPLGRAVPSSRADISVAGGWSWTAVLCSMSGLTVAACRRSPRLSGSREPA